MVVRLRGWFILALFACLVLALDSPSLAGPATPAAPGDVAAPTYDGCGGDFVDATNAGFEEQLVELVNSTRAANGLPPLKRNVNLDYAARYYAADMSQDNYGNVDHKTYDRVNGSLVARCEWNARVTIYYFPFASLSENIGWGMTTPQEAMTWWMNSAGHKANILRTESWEIGVGYSTGQSGSGPYWVQDFGRQTYVYPVIINGEAAKTTSRTVSLYIYGTWDEIRFQNDGGAWSDWAPFQATPPWTLSAGNGTKTVCAQMRTGGGTPVQSCDTITLDESVPPPPGNKVKVYLPFVAKKYYSGPTGWQVIMQDDFDTQGNVPWIVKDTGTGTGSYLWDITDCRALSGKYSAWAVGRTEGGPDLPCFSHYPNDVKTWLTYGPFSLADATKAELRFQEFLNTQPDYKDYFFYGASTDGNLYHGYWASGNSQGWLAGFLDLANVPNLGNLTGRSEVWIAFVFVSDSSVTYPEGVLVDDVVLRKWVGQATQALPGEYLTGTASQHWAEAGITISEKTLRR